MTRPTMNSVWSMVDGLRMHARASTWPTRPDAQVAVLVHGFVVSSAYMVPTALRLAPDWRVFAPDLPGFGRSDHPPRPQSVPEQANAVAGWMRAQRLAGATLLGNSLGCQVVVDLAARYPDLAEALILVGPTVDPAARSVRAQLVRLLRDTLRERPSLIALHARDWVRAGPAEIVETIRRAIDDRIEQKLPLVRAPTLIVAGGRDPLVPRAWARQATGLLPNGRLVVIPDAPHALNYSAPEPLVAAVRAFRPSGSSHAAG